MSESREVEIKVGRRVNDGAIGLSAFLPGVLSLSVSRGAERGSSVQLTREQVHHLRQALAEMEMLIAPESPAAVRPAGVERRKEELAA